MEIKELKRWGLERHFLMHIRLFVLELCEWNLSLASRVLGISVRAMRININLYRKMGYTIPQKYGSKNEFLSRRRFDEIMKWMNQHKPTHLITKTILTVNGERIKRENNDNTKRHL